jgi:CoA:oxalate CoA-transferase
MNAALENIRVIDLTQYIMGPAATQILGDMGAQVIKIERLGGEPARKLGPFSSKGTSAYFEAHNRNKKSVEIDLKHPKGKEIVYRLAEKSDVFCENFQRGVVERLGFDYETLSRINPKIIYYSGSGFGLKGPMSNFLGYDGVGQAMGGILSTIWSPPGQPNPLIGCAIADQTGAFLSCLGIVLALHHRERTGEGQRVDVSLLGSGISQVGWLLQSFLFTGSPYKAKSRARITPGLISSTHLAKDHKPLIIQMVGKEQIEQGLRLLGLQDLINDPVFEVEKLHENAAEILVILDGAFEKRNREDWLKKFEDGGVVSAPVLNCEDLAQHPQVLANEYIAQVNHPTEGCMKILGCPIKLSKTPARLGVAPKLGENTELILSEVAGCSRAEMTELKNKGVIR